jgi:serine O-acetyltransferase
VRRMGFTEQLVHARNKPVIGRSAREILALYGIDAGRRSTFARSFRMVHRGMGTVINGAVDVGERVMIFHQVTIGRADAHLPFARSSMERIRVEDDAVLCAGAKILGGPGVTTVGRGTIVAANAVLTGSTGEWEVWGGIPAKKISDRPRP